jgi:O-antigen/teichoic acid export membrane protein
MIKSFAALSITTGVRLLTGLVLFVLMAREWSADEFGHFMYLFSVAALLVLACEFGFAQQILREIGREPARAVALMGRFLGAKIWLTVATLLLAAGFAWFSHLSPAGMLQLVLLLAGGLAMSYTDFYMACFRAMGDFGQEAKLTIKGNLIYFMLAAMALYGGTGPKGVASALMLARLIHLALAYRIFRQRIPDRLPIDLRYTSTARTIKVSSAYGADVAVGAAFVNIDTVLIAHSLGNEGVAIYQAIARFYQGACLLPAIFGSLFLPKLARHLDDKPLFSRDFKNLNFSLVGSGLLIALMFIFGKPVLALVYDQPHLQSSLALLPWFGLLVFIRYVASVYGVVLTALGGQTSRALVYVAALCLMAFAAPWLMQHMGVAGMVLACTLAYVFLAISFAGLSWARGAKSRAWLASIASASILIYLTFWKVQA